MKKIKDTLIALVVLVIAVQLGWAAIQPYLPWIGLTLALLIIIGLIAGSIALARRFANSDGGGLMRGR